MSIKSNIAREHFILHGQVANHRKTFFSRDIPISLRASDDGLTFTIHHKIISSRTVPYEELHSVYLNQFLWKNRVVIHAGAGSETIRCSGSREKIFEFCSAVNARVIAKKKPLAARFQLTQLENPREQRVPLPDDLPKEYDSAVDFLFNPTKWGDDLFDKLETKISFPSNDAEPGSAPKAREERTVKKEHDVPKYTLFGASNKKVWDLYVNGKAIRTILLGVAVIVIGALAAKELSKLAGIKNDDRAAITTTTVSLPAKSVTAPQQHRPPVPPRFLEKLVEIMENEKWSYQLIASLKRSRIRLGISERDASTRIGWSETKLNGIETGDVRATAMDVIDYSVCVHADIFGMIEALQ